MNLLGLQEQRYWSQGCVLGAAFYSLKNVRFMHVVWHLFVMLAAILMYFLFSLYVITAQ